MIFLTARRWFGPQAMASSVAEYRDRDRPDRRGDTGGNFVVSADNDRIGSEFYDRVKHLPYKSGRQRN